jgi:alkyl sulfatase BDS1-like metallo-beta-lactamase superfamily hydrolase
MTSIDPASFAAMGPAEFSKYVKSASKGDLEALLASEHRKAILDSIFGRFPTQFRPDRAGNTNAVIHWVVSGAEGGDKYELVIADGVCTLSPSPAAEPRLTVTTGGLDFLNLVSGNANPMMMAMTGKLKIKGDMALAANLANLFDLPKG